MNLTLPDEWIPVPQYASQVEQIEYFELWMKIEPYLHESLMLHLFKQATGKYEHKEFLFLADRINHYYQLYEKMPESFWQIV